MGRTYRLTFPLTHYEIDKANARFINVLTCQGLENATTKDNTASLSDEFFRMNLSTGSPPPPGLSFDDSTETVTVTMSDGGTFEERRILFAIPNCVRNDIREVERYLNESPDKHIFLHGKKEHDGDTCLIMASQEGHSAMVSLLLKHGAEINATNHEGRTALMEASLWGRSETVEVLLSQGADPLLPDRENRKALDLCAPNRKNQKERHTRVGGVWGSPRTKPWYIEDTVNRDAERRLIARILEAKDQSALQAGTENQHNQVFEAGHYHRFYRPSDRLSILHCGPIQDLSVPNSYKTIAVLQRGDHFPTVSSMSGWFHSERLSRLSGCEWTEKVIKLAAIVGHTLSVDPRKDRGVPGRFQASHAEKQLIAYFVDRHCFLPEDKVPNPRLDRQIEDLESQVAAKGSQYPTISQFYNLLHIKQILERQLSMENSPSRENYDKVLARQPKTNLESLEKELKALQHRAEIQEIINLKRQIEKWEDKKKLHSKLNALSREAPSEGLRKAFIGISSPSYEICADCLSFRTRVNRYFGLSIELRECTQ